MPPDFGNRHHFYKQNPINVPFLSFSICRFTLRHHFSTLYLGTSEPDSDISQNTKVNIETILDNTNMYLITHYMCYVAIR